MIILIAAFTGCSLRSQAIIKVIWVFVGRVEVANPDIIIFILRSLLFLDALESLMSTPFDT